MGNKVAYDILVSPRDVQAFDTLALATALDTSVEFIRGKMQEYEKNRRKIGFQSVTMLKQIPAETYNKFAEVQYRFPGFKGQVRGIRDYPINAGGNLLGYVSEVNQAYIDNHPGEYRSGDYAGMTGIEAAREKDLRGEKGYHIFLRNSHNQIEQPYKDGEFDKEAVPGHDIVATKGRFGPYLKWGERNIKLPRSADPLKITLEECVRLIGETPEQPAANPVIAQWGDLQIVNGRYGPYLKSGENNYRIPKGTDVTTLTEADCQAIIAASEPTSKGFRRFKK